MEFRKKGKLELKDYITFNNFHNTKQMLIAALIMVIVIPPLFLLIDILEDTAGLLPRYLYFLLLSIVALALITPLQIWIVRARSKRQYYSSKAMQAESENIVNEEGVFEISEYGSTSYHWKDIYKADEGKHAFYIYISRLQAWILPKRFLSAQETDTLRGLIGKYLDPKKNHLKKRLV